MGRMRTPTPVANRQRINEHIRSPSVRVIANDGAQLGILATADAMEAARQEGLDLVEVAPQEDPPVCRIMDYGKYKYQQRKRQSRTHTHQTKIKEIRVRPKTGVHDINVRVNRAREFLGNNDKVLLIVMFKGREMAHIDEGHRVINKVIEQLEDVARVETPPIRHGRRITCILAPK